MEHANEKTEKYGYHHYKHLQKREYDFVRLSTRVRLFPSPSSPFLPSFLPHNHPDITIKEIPTLFSHSKSKTFYIRFDKSHGMGKRTWPEIYYTLHIRHSHFLIPDGNFSTRLFLYFVTFLQIYTYVEYEYFWKMR